MKEPSPDTVPSFADVQPAPVPNGTPLQDIEMTDSAPVSEVISSALHSPSWRNPQNTDTKKLIEPTNSIQNSEAAVEPALVPSAANQTASTSTSTFPPTPTPSQPPAPAPTPAVHHAPPTTSSRNSPHPTATAQQPPTHPIPHGSPTRVYLNQNVTPHLLEAMKHLATTEPEKPLKWLSEFLAQKSAEIEG